MQGQSDRSKTTPGIANLLREADEIIAMSKDLQNRGYPREAACFALVATKRLRLARILQGIQNVG